MIVLSSSQKHKHNTELQPDKANKARAQLFKRADNTIQCISVNKSKCAIHRVEIHSVDSIIHPSDNGGQLIYNQAPNALF